MSQMAGKLFLFRALSLCNTMLRRSGFPLSFQGKPPPHLRHHKFSSLLQKPSHELSKQTLIFHVEGSLLRSSSLFPYFMLVAFEAGGPLRALLLYLVYPFVCLLAREETRLKFMVLVCFFGIRKEGFKVGSSVLPKFFLEDVGCEGMEMVMRCGGAVGVSDLPRVMVEGFMREYLGFESVVGRELKVVCGYFVGLMEDDERSSVALKKILAHRKTSSLIGLGCTNSSLGEQLRLHCEEVYMVGESEKRAWQSLPRSKYQKPLIFHDGRLAIRPTLSATLFMFLWLPLGVTVFLIRLLAGTLLPYTLTSPILAFTGCRNTVSSPPPRRRKSSRKNPTRGSLYVCNHRTLLDPLYLGLALLDKSITAVTYSMSWFNEVISPIPTIRLNRDREKDAEMMERVLSQGDLVVCPEGTTCREPYLLRFSPLFAEMSNEIKPVAIDVKVSMFYGTTASGLKFLDPFFQLANPFPVYYVKFLEKVKGVGSCDSDRVGSRFEVANHVQAEIARALGFECTSLTRRDKYRSLAGNDGFV